jgi:hypothetical protein
MSRILGGSVGALLCWNHVIRYDDHDLLDPETGILYAAISEEETELICEDAGSCGQVLRVGDQAYLPRRRYRDAQGLRRELARQGFGVLLQTGAYGENVACVKL